MFSGKEQEPLKVLKTILISLLCICLMLPSVTAFAEEGQVTDVSSAEGVDTALTGEAVGVTPERVSASISSFSTAVKALAPATADFTTLDVYMERLSALTSTVSGGLVILRMMGIMKDAQTAALYDILGEITSVQESLVNMQKELDALVSQLIDIAVDEKEIDRQTTARDLLSYWRTFKDTYVNPLQAYAEEYQGKINNALRAWWNNESHDGVRVLYTDYNGETVLTYSRLAYDEGFPKQADNGEIVLAESSYGLPAEYMPATSEVLFNIDTYAEDFRVLLGKAFVAAADDGKLDASDAFYTEWNKLNPERKPYVARDYADDFLSTIIYHLACETMSTDENNLWVIDLVNAYTNFCDNILEVDTGINALINVQYYTHGFEKEVKGTINEICDAMVVTAGYYGTLALNAASQDNMQPLAKKQTLQEKWVNTILKLDDKRNTALTGHDNYCYVAGGLVRYDRIQARSTVTFVYMDERDYESFSYSPWIFANYDHGTQITMPAILNDVTSVMLYHQFLAQNTGGAEFRNYLHACGTGTPEPGQDFQFMTNCRGTQTFALSDGLEMGWSLVSGTYFYGSGPFQINRNNPSKIEDEYFVLHDKLVVDYLDPKTGTVSVNQIAGARAAYEEDHCYWFTDEMHFFWKNTAVDWKITRETIEHWLEDETKITKVYTVSTPIHILAVDALKLEEYPEDSPLKAFGQGYIEPEPVEPDKYYSTAKWDSVDRNKLNLYKEVDQAALPEGINSKIELELNRAEKEGKNIVLSDAEKSDLEKQIETMLLDLQEEMMSNNSLEYIDAFGINGNQKAMTALVNAVIPEGMDFFDNNIDVMLSNTNVIAKYEPWVALHFSEEDGKIVPVLNPGFLVTPILVAWGPYDEDCSFFEISGDVMKELGLTMDLRIPAVSAGDKKSLTVIHYDNVKNLNKLETVQLDVLGSGTDKYVKLTVTSCSPFELDLSAETPATGDPNSMTFWIILMAFAALTITAGALMLRQKRKS